MIVIPSLNAVTTPFSTVPTAGLLLFQVIFWFVALLGLIWDSNPSVSPTNISVLFLFKAIPLTSTLFPYITSFALPNGLFPKYSKSSAKNLFSISIFSVPYLLLNALSPILTEDTLKGFGISLSDLKLFPIDIYSREDGNVY
jgi:hypothetical protein